MQRKQAKHKTGTPLLYLKPLSCVLMSPSQRMQTVLDSTASKQPLPTSYRQVVKITKIRQHFDGETGSNSLPTVTKISCLKNIEQLFINRCFSSFNSTYFSFVLNKEVSLWKKTLAGKLNILPKAHLLKTQEVMIQKTFQLK